MSDDRRPKRFISSRPAALFLAVSLAAGCVDDSVAPAPSSPPPAAPRVLGFAELSFDGIGTPDMSSSMLSAPSIAALEELRAERDRLRGLGEDVALDLTFPSPGNGTIQFGTGTSTQFTLDDVRYVSGTFLVRNAQLNEVPYTTERTNLTLLAVSTDNTINGTAVRTLRLGDESPADPAIALDVLPTGLVEPDTDSLVSRRPDVLQVLTEDEVAAVTPPTGVTGIFPYAFVVRNIGDLRTLPASPGPDQFDGVVDFAFSIPEQGSADEDPQSLSFTFVAVDDSETRLTQSLQEQTPTAQLALQQRASTLEAETVTLLPGGTLPGVPGLRTICSVRTAGTAGSATAHLVNVDWTFDSFTPDPYATDGSASHISSSADFQATFSAAPDAFGPETFTVRGLQSGPAFLGQDYTLNGTTISTPQGLFFPGEEIEIALTSALVCPDQPPVARYRVQGGGTGTFGSDTGPYNAGNGPASVAIGDLDGDGSLDLAVTNFQGDNVSVLINNGNGAFPAQNNPTYAVGSAPQEVAIGDLDGDGSLDLAVTNEPDGTVSVLINNGDGTFPAQNNPTYAVGSAPVVGAIGDLNGDGSLDLAVSNSGDGNVSVLINNGDGTFQADTTYGAGTGPWFVAIGDLDGEGSLDLAVTNFQDDNVSVLINNGDGTFPAQNNPTYDAGSAPGGLAIGDLDGEGSLDLAVTNQNDSNVSILINNGNGTFPLQNNPTYGTGSLPAGVAVGDLDGEGSLDLAVTNNNDGNVSVLINNGGGTFPTQNNPTFAADSGSTEVAIGDLDGDGSLDLAVANQGAANQDVGNVSVLPGVPASAVTSSASRSRHLADPFPRENVKQESRHVRESTTETLHREPPGYSLARRKPGHRLRR